MKANRSKTYLLPLLLKEINFDLTYFSIIQNTYIRSTDKENYKDCIFITFLNQDTAEPGFNKIFKENDFYIQTIVGEKYTILVYYFPDIFLKEYKFFKRSKYSEFGADAKVYITQFWRKFNKSNAAKAFYFKLKGILYREESLRIKMEEDLAVEIPETAELGELIKITDEVIKLK